MMSPLIAITYNVQSLCQGKKGVRKRCDIRNFINKSVPKPEVILLQEIHYGIRDCIANTSQLHFKRGLQFWNESKFSATSGKYKGSTTILVSEQLAPYVEDHGVLISS